jgi:uncharacterized membrane protein YkoI
MKNSLIYFVAILLAGAFFACGDEDEVVGPLTSEQAVSQALGSLSGTTGTVSSTEMDSTSSNQVYYDIDVITSEGAVIEFEYFQADGKLKSIEGDSGPFDYEVNPGMGLILYSNAKGTALGTIQDQSGQVLRWVLAFDDDLNTWVYTFEVMNGNEEESTVMIDAATGNIIQ